MRIESSVTSITWIPSEAIEGMPKLPFEWGLAHYDEPPSDRLVDIEAMHENDLFREANELKAWVEVDDDGTITDCGYSGGGRVGVTRLKLFRREVAFPAVQYPAIQAEPEIEDGSARFVQSAYVHQGQVCASPERLFVHCSLVEQVTQKMAAMLSQMVIGSPLDEHAQFGPLSNKPHFDKILGFFDRALQGNQVVCGARAVDRAGYYVEPTLIVATGKDDPLLHEETFGPVVCVLGFDDEEELVELMNDSPFGLTASIWTNDLSKALRLIPRIEAGTVWVNMHTFVDPSVPFGGMKASGVGREFGSAFIDDYTELKSVIIRY